MHMAGPVHAVCVLHIIFEPLWPTTQMLAVKQLGHTSKHGNKLLGTLAQDVACLSAVASLLAADDRSPLQG